MLIMKQVSATFSFFSGEGFVGDATACQVAVKFAASANARPLILSELRVQFNTNIRSLVISHSDDYKKSWSTDLQVREESDSAHPMAKGLLSSANLTFEPGQVRVFNLSIPLRDPDSFNATGASLVLNSDDVTLEHVLSRPSDVRCPHWWIQSRDRLVKKQLSRGEPNSIQVLPKPPKVQLRILNLRDQYFTGEKVALSIEVLNGEAEDVEAVLRAEGQDDSGLKLELGWGGDKYGADETDPLALQIGKMLSGGSSSQVLTFLAPSNLAEYTLKLDVGYRLSSDTETPITKSLESVIPFVSPFEANYDFGPRLYTGDYPNFFDLPGLDDDDDDRGHPEKAHGLTQNWCLTSRVVSFSSEPLIIESTKIIVNRVTSNALCTVADSMESQKLPQTMLLKSMVDLPHMFEVRKLTLEDRRPSALDLSLAITWRRQNTSEEQEETTTTILAVPSMTIPSAEPRVLCTTSRPGSANETVTVSYTLENPSMHFLTFNLTMEASDSFAFSGAKHRTVSLTPMSRVQVDYRLCVYNVDNEALSEYEGQKGHWVWPALRVVDAYFQKTLRVLDAGDGVQSDDGGGLGIWIPQ